MSDNRKYYYLKLKESYFDDDAIVLLESMQDGMLYSNKACRFERITGDRYKVWVSCPHCGFENRFDAQALDI